MIEQPRDVGTTITIEGTQYDVTDYYRVGDYGPHVWILTRNDEYQGMLVVSPSGVGETQFI